MIASLTPRELEVAIKNGTTQEELLLEYNCSREEFDVKMESLYPNKNVRRSKFRKLQSNSRSHKPNKSKSRSKSETTSIEAPVQQPTDEPTEVETLLDAISAQREQIFKQISEKSNELNQLELQHKSYEQIRNEIRNTLKSYRDKIIKLHDECLRTQKKIDEKVSELNALASKMQELNEPINAMHADISQLEEALKSSNVVIFAYNSGEILINDIRVATFNGWEETYTQLRTRDDIDDRLTLFQLKQLAKLITVTNELNSDSMRFEVMFDSDVVEGAYRSISG